LELPWISILDNLPLKRRLNDVPEEDDAAHVASPIGAQGNNMAIQDAVTAHRILTPVLKRETASVSIDVLQRVELIRRPVIEEVLESQQSMGEGLTGLSHTNLLSYKVRVL
jgi:2-polyprenyl-6-methoxyphenol hydroxylase-like FAD-dependent oxidoreductase